MYLFTSNICWLLQGWNKSYPFNTGDLVISTNVLFNYLEANNRIPWEDLRYLFGEIMYGGHITDDWDRRLCKVCLLKKGYAWTAYISTVRTAVAGRVKPSSFWDPFSLSKPLALHVRSSKFVMWLMSQIGLRLSTLRFMLHLILKPSSGLPRRVHPPRPTGRGTAAGAGVPQPSQHGLPGAWFKWKLCLVFAQNIAWDSFFYSDTDQSA